MKAFSILLLVIVIALPLCGQAQTTRPVPIIKTTPISEEKFYRLLQDSFEACHYRIDFFSGKSSYKDLVAYAQYINTILYYWRPLYRHGHFRSSILRDRLLWIIAEENENLMGLDSRVSGYQDNIIIDEDNVLYRYEIKFDLERDNKITAYINTYIAPFMKDVGSGIYDLDRLYCSLSYRKMTEPLLYKYIKQLQRWRYNYFKPIAYWDTPIGDRFNPFFECIDEY